MRPTGTVTGRYSFTSSMPLFDPDLCNAASVASPSGIVAGPPFPLF